MRNFICVSSCSPHPFLNRLLLLLLYLLSSLSQKNFLVLDQGTLGKIQARDPAKGYGET